MGSKWLSVDDGIELNDGKTVSGRLDDDDWKHSEEPIGNRRFITNRGSPDSAFHRSKKPPLVTSNNDELKASTHLMEQLSPLVTSDEDDFKSSTELLREEQPPLVTSNDDDKFKASTEHLMQEQSIIRQKHFKKLEKIFSTRQADLGVLPMVVDGMVPDNSDARIWVTPLLACLGIEEYTVASLQKKLNDQSVIALFMICVIQLVNFFVAIICKSSYFWVGLCFYWICILSIFAYLHWLRYKLNLVKKYRVSIAEMAQDLNDDLPPDVCAYCSPYIDSLHLYSKQSLGLVDGCIFNANLFIFLSFFLFLFNA